MNKQIDKYDERGNIIYHKSSYSGGLEYWREFDKNNDMIYYKNNEGEEHFVLLKNSFSCFLNSISSNSFFVISIL